MPLLRKPSFIFPFTSLSLRSYFPSPTPLSLTHSLTVFGCIHSGAIDTPMTRTMYGPPGVSDASKAILGAVPMKRYGEAEEVAKLVLFLLGNESSYCTGSVMVVDGGLTA